jgi:hypothetical protein
VTIVQRQRVEECVWLRDPQHTTRRAGRAYRGRPARVEDARQATVEVRVDEAALEAAVRRLGWQVYATHQPGVPLPLAQAVWAYRRA